MKGDLMAWWSRWAGPAQALGLELGTSAVKLVDLSRSAQGMLTLNGYALAPLSPGVFVDGQIEQFDAAVKAVRAGVQRLRLRTKRVVMGLPAVGLIQSRVQVPANLTDADLLDQVEAQAAKRMPFPLEELALDFAVLGPAKDEPSSLEVLISAARMERVLDRLALAEAAGLEPVVMETESNAAQVAWHAWRQRTGGAADAQAVALVEIEPQGISLKVTDAEELLFERELVCQDRPASDRAAREVSRMLQFFRAEHPGRRLELALLVGDAAGQDGLQEAVAWASGLEVRLLDPFARMRLGPRVDRLELPGHARSLLQACGLALRGLET